MSAHTMHRIPALLGLVVILVLALTAGGAPIAAQPAVATPSSAATGDAFHSSPVMFIENAGQWPEAARFQAWGGTAGTMWLAEDAIWITVDEQTPAVDSRTNRLRRLDPAAFDLEPSDLPPARAVNIKLSFVSANAHPRIEPFDRLDTVVSYFIGNDPDRWRPAVPVWGGVRYVDLYPGVDLEIASEGGQMVQRLDAQPGGDLGAVRLRIEGADAVTVDGEALRLSTVAGEVAWPLLRTEGPSHRATAQSVNAQIFVVTAPYTQVRVAPTPPNTNGSHLVGDNPQSLVDNPADLLYGTFLGGRGSDAGYGIAVDGNGAVYITGETWSADFPTTTGAFDTSFNGYWDTFTVKLDPSGSALTYATFLGGNDWDFGYGIAIGENGTAYVTGWTRSATFPVTPGAFDRSYNGGDYLGDAFVIKLDRSGSVLVYATYLGGSERDWGEGIAADVSGATYVTGWTVSANFPTTSGAFDRSYNGGDAFVVKLNPSGSALTYATYLGGSSDDFGHGIAVDDSSAAYVTGSTYSDDFPTIVNAFDTSSNGEWDAFVVKLNPSGSALAYATLLGGSRRDISGNIAIDASGHAFITGATESGDFPTTPSAFDTSLGGEWDAFLVKLNPFGSALSYATFLGGSTEEFGYGLAVDEIGVAYATGMTSSVDFPATSNAFDTSFNGSWDAFVVKLAPAGNRLDYATFLGGSTAEWSESSVALGSAGSVYVTSETGSNDFPTTTGAFDTRFNGDWEAFVVKLAMGIAPTYIISGRVTEAGGFTGIGGVTVWADSTHSTTTNANGDYTLTGLPAGTYTIRPEKAPYAFSPASRTVTVPGNATGVDFQAVAITNIQVNQVLGNTTNYVAGKDTAVRVFLSGAVPFDPDHQQLQIYRNGNLITPTPLRPRSFTGRSDVLDFLCDRAECDAWQRGFYTFEARVNGDYLSQPSVEFKERKGLSILVVPVRVKVGGVDTSPGDDWKTAQEFLLKVYPVARKDVSWEHGREIDATDLDLSTDEGKKELQKRLYDRRSLQCKIALGFGIICYDAILGILPVDSLCPVQQTPCLVSGQSYPELKMAVVTDIPDLQLVVAHEIGHIIGYTSDGSGGLGDEYDKNCGAFQCGINPPPNNYVGRNSFSGSCEHPISCQFSQAKPWEGKAGMGSKVSGIGVDQDYPFDVTARRALTDSLSFMGAAGAGLQNYWVTPRAYNNLFVSLLDLTQVVVTSQAEERVLFVSGSIRRDGAASFEPAYHTMYAAPPAVAGEYSLHVVDASGSILASQGFNALFVALSDPPQDLDEAPFGVTVRLPDGARTLRIMRGTTILAQKVISPNSPIVSLTYPTAGQTWAATGNYTVRWQGSDLDGDALHYTVLYRQGAGDWMVLGADLTASELTVNAAGLPGGTAAQVQVLASDGINTTAVESGLFTVGRKPPEAFITYPADGASFMPGVSFFLQGTAYDLEDGTLPDSAYRWRSNRDGDLGTGATNLVILSPGPHVITLTVTDSDGNRATATIRISAGSEQFMPLILRGQ